MGRKNPKSECITFNGVVYRRYPESKSWHLKSYYNPHISDRMRGVQSLHREIWKVANGPIPEGHEIDHIDGNPLNNELSNLRLLTQEQHIEKHREGHSRRAKSAENLEYLKRAIAAAAAWHKSPEGQEWHSKHGKASWVGRVKSSVVCTFCGTEYKTHVPYRAKFCTTSCRQRCYWAAGKRPPRKRKK